MTVKLYIVEASPAVRAVLLLVEAIGIDVEFKIIDLAAGDHLKPEFLKLNPQHTVPTLEDGDFAIWDSHAINIYLIEKYAANNSLYPKDHKKRAVIHQRLHFDSGILFPDIATAFRPIIYEGAKDVTKVGIDKVIQGYKLLESLLNGNDYVAGDFLSIADFSVVASVTSTDILIPIDEEQFPNIGAWLKRMRSLPYYEKANQIGLEKLGAILKKNVTE